MEKYRPTRYVLLIAAACSGVAVWAGPLHDAEPAVDPKPVLDEDAVRRITAHFTKQEVTGSPGGLGNLAPLTQDQVRIAHEQIWGAYRAGAVAKGWDCELAKAAPLPAFMKRKTEAGRPVIPAFQSGDKKMPYVFLRKGKRGSGGWPLFISLHGGGRAPGKTTPHGWSVNNREWQAQMALFERVYKGSGLYFIPRMADDGDGRWWFGYCQEIYARLLKRAILFADVDPNRVYLMGISEGGYGAYRLAPFFADRLAGAGAMAAGGLAENCPPENLHSTAFRTDVGAHDDMFNRRSYAQAYHRKLDELKGDLPASYPNHLELQKNRGHGIDYGFQPTWLAKHVRDPYPARITWRVQPLHGRTRRQMFWLGCRKPPESGSFLITASLDKKANSVTVTAVHETVTETKDPGDPEKTHQETETCPIKDNVLEVYLNDDLLDLDRPVTVTCNGKPIFEGPVERRAENMVTTLEPRGDPFFMFPGIVTVALPEGTGK